MKLTVNCDWCGKPIERFPSQLKKHNFCSRTCLSAFSSRSKNPTGYAKLKDYTGMSEHMHDLNEEMNPERMNFYTRTRLRQARLNTGQGKTYAKTYGRATHRLAAAQKLKRPLRPGEVVHHIDGNKRNNSPENLMVFSSQAEHAAWHMVQCRKEGDAK